MEKIICRRLFCAGMLFCIKEGDNGIMIWIQDEISPRRACEVVNFLIN